MLKSVVDVPVSICLEMPKEAQDSGSSGTGIEGSYGLPNTSAGNQIWVLWENRKHF